MKVILCSGLTSIDSEAFMVASFLKLFKVHTHFTFVSEFYLILHRSGTVDIKYRAILVLDQSKVFTKFDESVAKEKEILPQLC